MVYSPSVLEFASEAHVGMSCPARVVNCTVFTYLPVKYRYITFINTVNVSATILAGCDGHEIVCNVTVKGLFAD